MTRFGVDFGAGIQVQSLHPAASRAPPKPHTQKPQKIPTFYDRVFHLSLIFNGSCSGFPPQAGVIVRTVQQPRAAS